MPHIRNLSLSNRPQTVAHVTGRTHVQVLGNPTQGDDRFGAQARGDPQLLRVRLRQSGQLLAPPSAPVQFLGQDALGLLFGGLPPLRSTEP